MRPFTQAVAQRRRRLPGALVVCVLLSPGVLLTLWLRLRSSLPNHLDPLIGDGTDRLNFRAASVCQSELKGRGVPGTVGTDARSRAYGRMANDMVTKGLRIEGGQGMSNSKLFRKSPSGIVEPKLQVLDIPVRAIVFKFQEENVKKMLQRSTRRAFGKVFGNRGLWFQDPEIYHSTVFHASNHLHSEAATALEVEREVADIARVAASLCPLTVVLERVLVTGTGVVVAAWQVKAGSEPSVVRSRLSDALPRAPPKESQTVREPDILYTTLARLLEPPAAPDIELTSTTSERQRLFQGVTTVHDAAETMTKELCGIEARIHSLWYVEEVHLLALAIGGLHRDTEVPMLCV